MSRMFLLVLTYLGYPDMGVGLLPQSPNTNYAALEEKEVLDRRACSWEVVNDGGYLRRIVHKGGSFIWLFEE